MTTSETESAATASAPTQVWFESDGVRLFAIESGDGDAIVFLHGGLADHRSALLRVAPLSQTHRLICPDLRGSGRSVYSGSLTWDQLADDLASLLEHLGLDKAIVGGTSMGSAVALKFALRHPNLLRGLMLRSPLYPGADRQLAPAAKAAMHRMQQAGESARTRGVEALRPLLEGLPSQAARDLALEMMNQFDAGSVVATTRFLASGQQPMTSVRELASIDVPVLLLPGIDPEHPAEVAALYAQHLQHAVVVEQTAPDLMEKTARFCVDCKRDARGHDPK